MKKGFALIETLIVIAFVCASLLMFYGFIMDMTKNNANNLRYDDISNIYKAYYLKEYLDIKIDDNVDIKELNCEDSTCNKLKDELDIKSFYLVKSDLKNYNKENFDAELNNYLNTLSNNVPYKYRFVVLFNDNYSYASVGVKNE